MDHLRLYMAKDPKVAVTACTKTNVGAPHYLANPF